ncbi:MAG: FeoA family protein [bacterium]
MNDTERDGFRPLSALRVGDAAVIDRLDGDDDAMLHLMERGLTGGERVRLIRGAPLGGPLEVELMGYRLAIRRAEADRILVRSEP